MKLLMILFLTILTCCSCSKTQWAKQWGGETTIQVEGELMNAFYEQGSFWALYKTNKGEAKLQEFSTHGLITTTIIIKHYGK